MAGIIRQALHRRFPSRAAPGRTAVLADLPGAVMPPRDPVPLRHRRTAEGPSSARIAAGVRRPVMAGLGAPDAAG